ARRARAASWGEVAAELRWDPGALEYACEREAAYAEARERARDAADAEAEAEGLHKLRELLRADPVTALDAAKTLSKYLSDARRDKPRLAVEKLRAEAKIAAANARLAKARQQEDDAPQLTPEDQAQMERAFWHSQEQSAEDGSKPLAEVYVWG